MSYAAQSASKTFSNGAVSNTTAPTFSGIAAAVSQADGSVVASWALATGSAATPIRYIIYAAPGASVAPASLFVGANIVAEGRSTWTAARFTQQGDQATFLNPGSVYTVGVRAFSAQNIIETNTVTANVTIAYPNFNTVSATVWDQLQSAHVIAGSFGSFLDAKVSLAQTAATAVTQYNALVTAIGLLQTSATALSQFNSLSTAVGLVQSAATALSQYSALISAIGSTQQASSSTSQYNNLQSAIALLQSAATSLSQFNTLVTNIGLVGTTATAIFARTDVATSSRATPADITTAQAALTSLINAVAGNVWEQLISSHNTAGSFGANAQTPAINPAQVAAAVWDALTSAHTAAGSFGLSAQTPSLNPTQVANAVWDALISAHSANGSFGATIQSPITLAEKVPVLSFTAVMDVVPALEATMAAPENILATISGVPSLVAIMTD